ncbi:Rho1 guanine nucleotide exchange factor 3 [Ceratocystis lukuohia]|uniref:Rho1 guanine nucleotide exchange factor 3 n=1 Tax=Ceratocystis lukuohia TaxID=2019550 RepID=A0ABR4M9M2_9PEZI
MSFCSDAQGHYGHVPPVQYPVGENDTTNSSGATGVSRQLSFNNGDDAVSVSHYPNQHQHQHQHQHHQYQQAQAQSQHSFRQQQGPDELFLPAASMAATSARGSINHGSSYSPGSSVAVYNPQTFRSNTVSQPYHSSPTTSRYGNSPTYSSTSAGMSQQQSQQQQQQQQQPPHNFAPQAYNPAAYANTSTPIQRGPTYHGYSNYSGNGSAGSRSLSHSRSQYSGPSSAVSTTSSFISPATAQSSQSTTSYNSSQTYDLPPTPVAGSHSHSHSHSFNSISSNSAIPVIGAPVPGANPAASYNPSSFKSLAHGHYSQPGALPPSASSVSPPLEMPVQIPPYPITAHDAIPVGPVFAAEESDAAYYDGLAASRIARSNSHASQQSYMPSYSPSGLSRHPTNAPLPSRPVEDEYNNWNNDGNADNYDAEEYAREYVTQDTLMEDIQAMTLQLHHTPSVSKNNHVSPDEMDNLRWKDSPSAAPSAAPAPLGGYRQSEIIGDNSAINSGTVEPNNYDYGEFKEQSDSGGNDEEDDEYANMGLAMMKEAEMAEKSRRFSSVHSIGSPGSAAPSFLSPQTSSFANSSTSLHSGATLTQSTANSVGTSSESEPAQMQPLEQGNYDGTQDPDAAYYSGHLQTYGADGTFNEAVQIHKSYDNSNNNNGYGYDSYPSQSNPNEAQRPQNHHHHSFKYGDSENKPGFEDADMDYGNTGGLHTPTPKVPVANYDEADVEEDHSSIASGSDEYPDMFYHPGPINRPLPSLPPVPADDQGYHNDNYHDGYNDAYSDAYDPSQPNPAIEHTSNYSTDAQASGLVERSSSMNVHSHTPTVTTPLRSRTDASELRRGARTSMLPAAATEAQNYPHYQGNPNNLTSFDIALPQGRKRRFVPSKLSSSDIRRCKEPWALSSLASWIQDMADGEPDLKKKTVEEGLVVLFTAKVHTMNIADAETLGAYVVSLMFQAEFLMPEEEWVKFGSGSISGVLWQLTGSGCYAPKLHETQMNGRCYSHHCARTLKKANLDSILSEDFAKSLDWDAHYKITPEILGTKSKEEAKRQRILHEVITGEEGYMNQLEVLRVLYRDELYNARPAIILPQKLDKFLQQVFGKVDPVLRANKDNLLAQLKYRQQEQGPWVSGISDLFREWIRKARDAYLAYAAAYPKAELLMRREQSRNLLFRQFLKEVSNHKRSERLEWPTFLKAPITRLQRYTLLLQTLVKHSEEGEEKVNLNKAIEEIHRVTLECDVKVDEVQKEVTISELANMIVLRPNIHSTLNLDHLGRELLMQGDLQRTGSKNMSWVNTHALLFDHYLILSKSYKDQRGEKKYDVSKEPIPMPLLVLESSNDDPISKQKGITAPLGRPTPAANSQLSRTNTPAGGIEQAGDDGKILYPFKIKHLGHEVFTLYASSAQARSEWCNKITEAKTRHAKALRSQNAEPFRLRVLADSGFAYESSVSQSKVPGVPIKETPLDTAIRDLEAVYGPGRGPAAVCRAQVNCSTGFSAFGKSLIAIGTDIGVYISETMNPRGWTKAIAVTKVTQIAVLEDFSVCLIITDRSLVSYRLDFVVSMGTSLGSNPTHGNPRNAPQRLAKDVSFFAAARMKDRMLVFYKRKEGVHNTFFKVLEPVYHKSTEKKSKLFGGWKSTGTTESFRDYDEFYLPVECYSLNLFHSYIAVATAKGFELLTLDKKQPLSIPDLRQPAIINIANRVRDQKPLGMFRLNDQEFLLAYEDCAVYVDKHGDVSRTLIMEYSGRQKKARGATLCGQYLLLFNEDYVEVRNAENGRLRQIIAGKDVRCLDYGARGPTGSVAAAAAAAAAGGANGSVATGLVDSRTTVKISMTHPEFTGMQIVLEMVLNNGHTEK